jgi:hypothetical protein
MNILRKFQEKATMIFKKPAIYQHTRTIFPEIAPKLAIPAQFQPDKRTTKLLFLLLIQS